jgi:hypothetical protein
MLKTTAILDAEDTSHSSPSNIGIVEKKYFTFAHPPE